MVESPKHAHTRLGKRTWVVMGTTAIVALTAATLTLLPGASSARATAPLQHQDNPRHSVVATAIPATATSSNVRAITDFSAPAATPVPVQASLTPVAPATGTATATATTPVTPTAIPPVAALVAEVEASGIDPGSNWTWTMGNTATYCGPISGSGTGCTYGEGGLEYTVFSGTPTLTLVAHELANAETQNDAVPSLLNEVAGAAAGTSWSPTDAVASCLVEHFMGFQDDAAGTWQCPVNLATTVAENIHDTY
jgi:hypothetical protein